MRIKWPFLAVMMALPSVASAQSLSNDMTCEQAIAHYQEHRRIEINQGGQVLPIDQGTPVREANLLRCSEDDDDEGPMDTMVPTSDNPECVIAKYCE